MSHALNALHTPDTIFSARHSPSWMLLAGASGTVNGLAFMACQQFVTHVTGAATQLGIDWSTGVAAEVAAIVLCFVAGAMTSVVPLQGRAARGLSPRWAAPLVAVALLIASVAVAGSIGLAGTFGEAGEAESFVLLSILAFANGLQNATVATATGLAVRTTHLTGPATDFGVHLGVAVLGRRSERPLAIKGAILRGGKVAIFIAGAALAFPLGGLLGFAAFLVPAGCVLAAAALSFVPAWGPSGYPAAAAPDAGQAREPATAPARPALTPAASR